jgi:hypothetical protein
VKRPTIEPRKGPPTASPGGGRPAFRSKPRRHVAIIDRPAAAALLAGRKTIESRFTRTRRAPVDRVRPGDRLYFKLSAGGFIGTCRVRRVAQFEDLTPFQIRNLRRRYGRAIAAPAAYWRERIRRRYGVLIWLSGLESLRRPPRIARQYGSGWVTLG